MTITETTGVVEDVPVFFDDLDAMGVVHNGRYTVLFERALIGFWSRQGWPYDPAAANFHETFFVVRESTITYHAPITGLGGVRVHFWVDEMGTSSAVYGFRVLSADGATVHAEGRRAQVKLDPATLRPQPIPDAVRAVARTLLADPSADRLAS